jgi:hypothetical protein
MSVCISCCASVAAEAEDSLKKTHSLILLIVQYLFCFYVFKGLRKKAPHEVLWVVELTSANIVCVWYA